MNVGDIYFSLRGDGSGLSVDAKKAGEAAGMVGAASFSAKFTNLFKAGTALGLGASVFGAVTSAIGGIDTALEGMTQKAIADEESQNRLAASLKANVPAFNGNTDAIEANIKAKQRLGFTDETLRDSLTVLVGATHDVSKAQDIQATAMDLARFKGIDLQTASEALIKVDAGVYRSLKSLGIVLRDGATQTEALAAVQAVAAGQAEAYANTTAGKAQAATVALDEAMEHLGKVGIPLVIEGAKDLTMALDRTTVPLIDLERSTATSSLGAQNQLHQLEKVALEMGVTLEQAWQMAQDAGSLSVDDIRKNVQLTTDSLDRSERSIFQSARAVATSFDSDAKAAQAMDLAIRAAGVSAAVAVENMRDRIVKAATGIVDKAYGNIMTADQLSSTNAEINAQRRIIAMGGAASGTDRATAAIDRQIKALEAASKAETAHTATLTDAIDKQIAQLDLSEQQLAIEAQRHDINESLNAAQEDLIKAQGGKDAGAISDALKKVADLKAQQAENERQLGVAAKRDALEAEKKAVEDKSQVRQDDLTKLKAALDDQKTAMNTSGNASVADAKSRLHELYKTQAEEVLALANAGKLGSKQVADALVDMHARLTTATGDEKAAILATIQALKDLQAQSLRTFVTLPGGGSIARPVSAGGGPTVSDSGPSGAIVRGQPLGPGTQPAVIRLEIGGKPLIDYIDEHLSYRFRN